MRSQTIKMLVLATLIIANIANAEFITREGISLKSGTGTVTFTGTNCYYLTGWSSDLNNRSKADEVINEANAMGISLIRLWAFNDNPADPYCIQSEPGVYNEDILIGLDYVLSRCQELGIKVVLTLTNNWSDYGGIDQYVAWADDAVEYDDFYTDDDCRTWYKNYVQMLVNRKNTFNGRIYGADDTVCYWELGNEMRSSDLSGDTLYAWYSEMAFYLKKELGVKQLISTGSEGAGNILNNGSDFVRNNSIPEIDIISLHCWPENWGISTENAMTWLEERVQVGHEQIQKPVFIGEFNISRGAGGDTVDRDNFLQGFYDLVNEEQVASTAFWMLCHDDYPDYDGYAVYYPADDTTIAVIEGQIGNNTITEIIVPDDYPTIQAAIDAASPGSTIIIKAGNYKENLIINIPLTLQGVDREKTIIHGKNRDRVISIGTASNSLPVNISGLTIRNGMTKHFNGGAGIYFEGSGNISDCIIKSNKANFNGSTTRGGGVFCHPDYSITVSGNLISRNYSKGFGGGVFGGENTIISDNDVINNKAHLGGGGIFIDGSAQVLRNYIKGNQCFEIGGAGIFAQGDNGTISNNIIIGNNKKNGGYYGKNLHSGGGVRFSNCSGFLLQNNVIMSNKEKHSIGGSFGGGVGIYQSDGTIQNNIIHLNKASKGAAIYADESSMVDVKYNLFTNLKKVSGAEIGIVNLEGNPKFIKPKFYRLKPDSPARDAGNPDILDLDASRSDMGVYGGLNSSAADPILADIAAQGELKVSPKTARVGRPLTFRAYFLNDGVVDTGEFQVSLMVDGVEVDTKTVKKLSPCCRRSIRLKWFQAEAGTHQITISADNAGVVEESSEINNQFTQTVEIESN